MTPLPNGSGKERVQMASSKTLFIIVGSQDKNSNTGEEPGGKS